MKRHPDPKHPPAIKMLPAPDPRDLNQQLQYLIQVIQKLATAHDLESIMAVVRTGARQLTHADGATFVLRDRDLCYYADEDAISPLWKGGRFPMSACISGWVMLNNQAVILEDIYADSRIPADAYRPTFVKSLAMVPIRSREPIGAIGNYWATHHCPSPEEMELLQTLADAAAVAMENVYLYDAQEQRIQERTAQLQHALNCESLLRRITDQVRDSLDQALIVMTVEQELRQGLSLQRCYTVLYHDESSGETQRDHSGTLTAKLAATLSRSAMKWDYPDLLPQLLLGQTVHCCVGPEKSPEQSQAEDAATESVGPKWELLICPISDGQHIVGDIRLYRRITEPFSDLEVQLVQQVVIQCAIALRHARLHSAVQTQVETLERLNQLKDDFLSTVSHELRSPMASIRMAVQMLQSVLGRAEMATSPEAHGGGMPGIVLPQSTYSKVMGYLTILNQECQRETNLINDLLTLTRLEAEVTPGEVQDITLQDWLPTIAAAFKARIQQRHQQLHIQIPEGLPRLRTNPTVLERIMTELLQNACKYTPDGETIIISATTPAIAKEASHLPVPPASAPESHCATGYFPNCSTPPVLLTVSNSGVTLSAYDRDHIFDTFYRIPKSDPWKYRGTGLGLALVKRLVRQISGAIEVANHDNSVAFTIRLNPCGAMMTS